MPRPTPTIPSGLCICRNPSCVIPFGTCHCGCGEKCGIAKQSNSKIGRIIGMPNIYVRASHAVAEKRPECRHEIVDGIACVWIPLTQGQWTLIQESDFSEHGRKNWCAHWVPTSRCFRAMRRIWENRNRISYLHREILGMEPNDRRLVDHINGNQLDNRRVNLRFADKSTNGCNRGKPSNNTSGFKGVVFDKRRKSRPWRATIKFRQIKHVLGQFATPEEAHAAYCNAAAQLHGEYARTQ